MRKVAFSVALLCATSSALAAPTDLSTWTEEGTGTWNVAADNNSVTQTVNGAPVVFYSDFNSLGRSLSGTIRVGTSSDDDFIGFVVGFNPGDLAAAATDFILIDWKQIDQNFYGFAPRGLAVSRVTAGLGNDSGAWSHNPALGVTEIARGATFGNVGWADFTTYTFDIEYTATNLKVFVNGSLEFDLDGTYSEGRFGFYNYSQAQVTYAGITDEILPPPPPGPGAIPEPATWAMMIGGFGLVGGAMRRRRLTAYVTA